VRERVVHQVPDNLPEPRLVAVHEERGAGCHAQVDRSVRRDHARVLDRVRGERQQVDGRDVQRTLLVEPGQGQQVLDEQAHPRRLRLEAVHDAVEVFWGQAVGGAIGRRRGGTVRSG
jgi:hypothetical protein